MHTGTNTDLHICTLHGGQCMLLYFSISGDLRAKNSNSGVAFRSVGQPSSQPVSQLVRYLFNIVPPSLRYGCVGLFKWHLSFRWEHRTRLCTENRYDRDGNAIKKSYYKTNIILVCSVDFASDAHTNTILKPTYWTYSTYGFDCKYIKYIWIAITGLDYMDVCMVGIVADGVST